MILVNGIDLSEYQTSPIPFDFRFADYPGSLTYAPITSLTLLNPANDLDPLSPYSPFYPLTLRRQLPINLIDDKDSSRERSGVVTHAVASNGNLTLTIEDTIQNVLTKSQVIASYMLRTPAELAKLLAESYGIDVDGSSFGAVHGVQTDDGLQFNLSVGTADNTELLDVLNQLCQAGFMRCAIWRGKLYFIGDHSGSSAMDILPQEIHTIPAQTQQVEQRYNGGSVKWEFGTQTLPNTNRQVSEFTADYSGTGILTLINPSGAITLMDKYNDARLVGRLYEIDILTDAIEQLTPGAFITFAPPILNRYTPMLAQYLGRGAPNEGNPFSTTCLFEVKNV